LPDRGNDLPDERPGVVVGDQAQEPPPAVSTVPITREGRKNLSSNSPAGIARRT
jgi:hypothetical protein